MDGLDFQPGCLPGLGDDWDFINAKPSALGSVHPYPAKFIPEIPRKLIAAYRPPSGSVLLDPFCGSGTSLAEAQSLGLPSVGVDLNPIAVLMSRVKTSPLPADVGSTLSEVIEAALADTAPVMPDIPRLDHWFLPDVQAAISSLAIAIVSRGGESRDLLRLALSSIIVRVSNQESDTRYAAITKAVGRDDVFRHFAKASSRLLEALHARPADLPQALVIEADVLTLTPDSIGRPVGLVVTSPPYPNAYEYWLYHKYRMWWLGFDPQAVKVREIGARAHFFKGSKSHTAEDFVRQMSQVMLFMSSVMIDEGHACFVVGRSKIQGKTVDNAAIIAEAGALHGFVEVTRAERVLASTRKSFNLSHANIKTETVLVLRKES